MLTRKSVSCSGVSHIVYEPFNSLRASRKNATDGWGWEGSLWLSMGEQIRTGQWAPKKDPMPAEIQSMIDYAASKDVKLMGYVYPCLDFTGGSKVPEANLGGSMDLSNAKFQKWMTQTMLDFLEVTGGGGFACKSHRLGSLWPSSRVAVSARSFWLSNMRQCSATHKAILLCR